MNEQSISSEIRLEKYCKNGEMSAAEIMHRVATGIAAVEAAPDKWRANFEQALNSGLIMAGRINSAAGTDIEATWVNCFVQPVGDAIAGLDSDGYPGIYDALREATETMRRGGGVGYDFSRLRPKGAVVKSTKSLASGPVSYMHVFDRSCETVESAGARRGAQMGVLRVDHPDIEEFIDAKTKAGQLKNFNLSIAITDEFMSAVVEDDDFDLVHQAEPGDTFKQNGAVCREGLWVYKKVKASELWDKIMRSTYDHAEPGVVFIDRINAENNLRYCETIESTNPCAEEPLPPYGCCCLGSINLTKFVTMPFTDEADFDWDGFCAVAHTAVRMLDNVLDGTLWPLHEQKEEAMSKRRIGLGILGLGDALTMLKKRYDAEESRGFAALIMRALRDEAYRASIDLAKERGPFPLFDAEKYLASPFIQRLPKVIQDGIKKHGIRNSHLLAIAPTGTISLAFADNASNGIEPAFSWYYQRKKDGQQYIVEDHALRLYKELHGLNGLANEEIINNLPSYFVSALQISASDHEKMVSVLQEYVDASISKTVNVPVDYPYEDFKDLYLQAWTSGSKGLATFRPNPITGAVLTTIESKVPENAPSDFDESDPDRRMRLDSVPKPTMLSLRWPRRPDLPGGNPAWSYVVKHPSGSKFAVFVGHIPNGKDYPFEVWVNGTEQPRGLGALAKVLSLDMYSRDRAWLSLKLESLAKTVGDDGFSLRMPPAGHELRVPSIVSGFAKLIHYRCNELGAFDDITETPVVDALMSPKEPKTGTNGTLSWTVDVLNPATGDDFVMGVKELVLPDGQRRPYSVWLSGVYPKVFDGLCKALSLDMRVIDPAWIGLKLRKLLNFSEPKGDFIAWVPGQHKQQNVPSTIAYLAMLMIHRYEMLGILDKDGHPIDVMGVVEQPTHPAIKLVRSVGAAETMPGKLCPECKSYSLAKVDGCERCTSCGYHGGCG